MLHPKSRTRRQITICAPSEASECPIGSSLEAAASSESIVTTIAPSTAADKGGGGEAAGWDSIPSRRDDVTSTTRERLRTLLLARRPDLGQTE